MVFFSLSFSLHLPRIHGSPFFLFLFQCPDSPLFYLCSLSISRVHSSSFSPLCSLPILLALFILSLLEDFSSLPLSLFNSLPRRHLHLSRSLSLFLLSPIFTFPLLTLVPSLSLLNSSIMSLPLSLILFLSLIPLFLKIYT